VIVLVGVMVKVGGPGVLVGVPVLVGVSVSVGDGVKVGVAVRLGVLDGVEVAVVVLDAVAEAVTEGVGVLVRVGVAVGEMVSVAVGLATTGEARETTVGVGIAPHPGRVLKMTTSNRNAAICFILGLQDWNGLCPILFAYTKAFEYDLQEIVTGRLASDLSQGVDCCGQVNGHQVGRQTGPVGGTCCAHVFEGPV
jgi:hypothetical protein